MDWVTEDRYSRQTRLSQIGQRGQNLLCSSRIAIVGLGALGTVIANHLARAGVGYLRLIDGDYVEMSNLTRQMLFDENDAREIVPKVIAASNKIQLINSDIEVDPRIIHLDERNAEELLSDVDLILDGTDNFSTRFLINDMSHKQTIPWIYGAVIQARGVVLPILPGETPCLRCILPNLPKTDRTETCDTVGVLGMAVSIVASYQSTEAMKYIVNDRSSMNLKMMQFDLWQNQFLAIDVSEATKEDCPCCRLGNYHFLQRKIEYTRIRTMCGRKTIQIQPQTPALHSLEEWEGRLQHYGTVERTPYLLKLSITDRLQFILFPDSRVIIQGTDSIEIAQKLYDYYLGK